MKVSFFISLLLCIEMFELLAVESKWGRRVVYKNKLIHLNKTLRPMTLFFHFGNFFKIIDFISKYQVSTSSYPALTLGKYYNPNS